jgi:hypothetical protein
MQKESPGAEVKHMTVQEIIEPAPVEKIEDAADFEMEPGPAEKTQEVASSKTELTPAAKEIVSKKTHVKEQESPILADKFSSLSNTLHDRMGIINTEDEISNVLKTQPINSLLEAIGLNDKFIFIFEIFKGNQAEYNQAISRLESAENLADAKAIIMSYTGENSESEAVLQLLELVKRKFLSHE